MGLPIPFNNVGKVIQDIFLPYGPRQLQYLKINIEQVFNYLSKYQSAVGKQLPNFEGIEQSRKNFMNKTVLKPTEITSDFSIGIGKPILSFKISPPDGFLIKVSWKFLSVAKLVT